MGEYAIFDDSPTGWGSESKRWNAYPEGVLPLWVADMDFPVAEPVCRALTDRIAAYPLWYGRDPGTHNETVATWLESQFQWQVNPDWVVWLPGLMSGIYQSVQSQSQKCQVVCQTPVYRPLAHAAELRQRLAASMCTTDDSRSWQWDYAAVTPETDARVLLLCHPHNPTGWSADRRQLMAIADYAKTHNMLVISDEIHCGITLDAPHLPFAVACPELTDRTLTFMSASKTWNIAGMYAAFAIIPNQQLRDRLIARLRYCGEPSELAVLANITALAQGEEWRQQLLGYLRISRTMIDEAVRSIPHLDWIPNQATHLGWIDCSGTGDAQKFHQQLITQGLALANGRDFGDSRFLRINYATTHARLRQALDILVQACRHL